MGLFDTNDLGLGAYAPKAPAYPGFYDLFQKALDGVKADQDEEANHLLDQANARAAVPVKRRFARPLAQGETFSPDTDISISDSGSQPSPPAPPTIGRMYDQQVPKTPFVDSPEQVAKDVADWQASRAEGTQHPAPEGSPLMTGLEGAGEGLLNMLPFVRSYVVSPVEAAQGPVQWNGIAQTGDFASNLVGGATEGMLGAIGGGLLSGGNPLGAAAGMAATSGYSSLAESAEQHRIDAMHEAEKQAATAPLFQPGTNTPAPIPTDVDTSRLGGFENLNGADYAMGGVNALIGGLGGHLGTKFTQQAVQTIAEKAGAQDLTEAALKSLTRTELGKAALKQLGYDVGSGVIAGGAGIGLQNKPTSYEDLKSLLTGKNALEIAKQAGLSAIASAGGQYVGFRGGKREGEEAGENMQNLRGVGSPDELQAAIDRYSPANIEAARKANPGPGILTRAQAAFRERSLQKQAAAAKAAEVEQLPPEVTVGTDTGKPVDIQTETMPGVGKPAEQPFSKSKYDDQDLTEELRQRLYDSASKSTPSSSYVKGSPKDMAKIRAHVENSNIPQVTFLNGERVESAGYKRVQQERAAFSAVDLGNAEEVPEKPQEPISQSMEQPSQATQPVEQPPEQAAAPANPVEQLEPKSLANPVPTDADESGVQQIIPDNEKVLPESEPKKQEIPELPPNEVNGEDETTYNRSLEASKEGPPFERKATKQPELPGTPPKKPPVEQSDQDSVEVNVPGSSEPTVLRRLDPVALHGMAKSLVDEIKLVGPGKSMSKMAKGALGYLKALKKKSSLELGIRHDLIRKEGVDKFNAVLAHEIGHAVDWGRDVTGKPTTSLSARGNVLGHIFALHKYMDDTFNPKIMEPGGHDAATIHSELVKLSEHWNPYDKAGAPKTDPSFIGYRESPKELYADFISAVLNDPATANEKAPHAVQAFVEAMDHRPEFAKTYHALMDDMAKPPEELASKRVGKMQSAFERGESELERQHAAREAYKKQMKPNSKENYIDKFGFIDRVAKKAAEGSPGYKALHHAIELVERMQFSYREMKVKEAHGKAMDALQEGYGNSEEALDKARSDAGAYIALNRIAKGDRADLVNPYNFQPRIAADTWEAYKKSLTPEQAKAVEKAVGHLSDMARNNLKERYEAGLLSKKDYARFTEDDKDKFYGTFRTLDHAKIDETPGFEPQHGTDKEIANPFTITFMKMERSAKQITEQHAKNATIDALGLMGEVKQVPPESKAGPDDKGLIVGFKDGKATHYEINPVLARAFREFRLPVEHGDIGNLLGSMNNATKMAYITYSMPFSVQQIPKDAIQALVLLPKQIKHTGPFGVFKDAGMVLKAMGMGLKDAKLYAQGKTSEDLDALFRTGVLEPDNPSPFSGTQPKHGDEMLRREGIIGPAPKGRVDVAISKIPYMSKLLDALYKISSGAEVHSKIYMYKLLKNSGMPEESISAFLRNAVGTPNFRRSGFQTQQMGRLFQFGNVVVQGLKLLHDTARGRTGIEGLDRKYMLKRIGNVSAALAVSNAVPILAQMGVFGDDLKEAYNKISDWDNGTHICIFYGWHTTKDGGREPKYWRMPMPEILQAPKNMMYQATVGALRGDGAASKVGDSLLDGVKAMAGALPGVSSSVNTVHNFFLIANGGKGYDTFRNQDILNDTDMKLGMGHRMAKFGKYAAGQLGGESLNPLNVPGRFVKGEPLFGTAHDNAPIPMDVRTEKAKSDAAAATRTIARQEALQKARDTKSLTPISEALNKGLITRNQALSARREYQQTSLERFTKGMDPARRKQIINQYQGKQK